MADPEADLHLVQAGAGSADGAGADEKVRAPWHFWLLVAAVVIYLGWRAVQGVAWLLR